LGGAGLIFVEATSVSPEGRLSKGDLGLWSDEQIAPLSRIVNFLKVHGTVAAIQLAHAGRKAAPDLPGSIAPSAIAFDKTYPKPSEMTHHDIFRVVRAFEAAARRAVQAGFQVVELHFAHGYLVHQFLSPLTNHRTDEYGGLFGNRTRLAREIVEAVKAAIPDDVLLFVRISASDWKEGGWTVEDSIALTKDLRHLHVDFLDVSSGGAVAGMWEHSLRGR
jgi:2,4-dienoyl-CoA reductase-like NADH-dependent reductase (Old Yellow Enzyme family)